ncbi:MAG: glycosyltransferase [Bacteroidota bacterium]
MKKKVVVFNSSYLKGSETFIYSQLKGLEKAFDVSFVTQDLMNLEKFPNDKITRIKSSFDQNLIKIFNPFYFGKTYSFRLEKVLSELSPDAIHVHFGTNAMRLAHVVKKLRIPMLITFHGADASKRLSDARYKGMLRKELANFDFICVSKAIAQNLKNIGIHVTKEHVHYIGVDTNQFSFHKRALIDSKVRRNEKVKFIQVARFVEKKGHFFTLHAFKDFLKEVINPERFILQFVGSGPLEKKMKELACSLELIENVEFLGVKDHDDVKMALENADAFLQHSVTPSSGDTEGLPIGIMEGMSTGLPVISTYHSGIPELIEDSQNGYLVEERDIKTYSKKMVDLIHTDSSSLGKKARKTIEDMFNLKVQNKKLVEIIDNLYIKY